MKHRRRQAPTGAGEETMSAPRGNKFAKGNKGGRLSPYKPVFAKQAKELCDRGATNGDLARFFDVAISTIHLWRIRIKSFRTQCG
jgi:hypothetical protein